MNGTGVAAMVSMGVWAESALQMEVLSIGRPATNMVEDCVMELVSKCLSYRVALRGTWIWLSVSAMDCADEPELLLRAADSKEGWDWVRRLVLALERDEIKSLQPRPLELRGGSGPNGFVIC